MCGRRLLILKMIEVEKMKIGWMVNDFVFRFGELV